LAEEAGIAAATWAETPLAAVAPTAPPPDLARLRESLFEAPGGGPVEGDAVELLTAPGEAAEARAIARRLLREAARGVPFEDMGVLLPRPDAYAPLFAELLARLGIPCRLHPSLPLSTGRAARSLLLLFRCRGFARPAVMEFLTFAPVPFEALLPADATPRPAQWDALSRDAGIVSGLDRWRVGLLTQARLEREAAADDPGGRPERRAQQLQRADDSERLLEVVEALAKTLDSLDGEASWSEWAARLRGVLDQWVGPENDREAVLEVIADLGGLGAFSPRARWSEVEDVLEARFEWERVPLQPLTTGAVHVGVLDAVAGLPFRVVAIPGLVEGGYPGVLRPDPFLLDAEREALSALARVDAASPAAPAAAAAERKHPDRPAKGQLSLLDTLGDVRRQPSISPAALGPGRLATTQDHLLAARRAFHGAVSQATERLILSYPRADPRSGRERLPSLFFVAAASALLGRPADAADLERLVVEDTLGALALEDTLDATERDRRRVQEGGEEAAQAIAKGSAFFKQSRLALRARLSYGYTRYDGYLGDLPPQVRNRLDPTHETASTSASRLATFARCGFQYLLQHVLRLEPALEPEERRRLEPLERGLLFHEVAENFLRERRDRGELPVQDTEAQIARLEALADQALLAFVQGSPPRFTRLWEHEKAQFKAALRRWLTREAASTDRARPAHFEVGFGLPPPKDAREPHSREPLVIDLGDGRRLRVNGKIDRIDRKEDGTLLLRDYKTGKAPRDDGGLFRGGKQLQIPFYILAAAQIFPEAPVTEAFLDYVDAPRRVAFEPKDVTGEEFLKFLRELLDVVASGIFVQEPSACDFCDFTAACGPKAILEWRRGPKSGDRLVQRALRLRNVL
jgi:RecB family exonuclease